MSGTTASARSAVGIVTRPSAQITTKIARPERKLLAAAQTSSASTTSSSPTGALTIASQVFCTCMRENAE